MADEACKKAKKAERAMIDPASMTRFNERTDLSALHEAISAGRIDRVGGVIRGVKLMGLESKNDRRYRVPEASLFEGVNVRIDHHGKEGGPDLPTDPSFRDIWATTKNAKASPEGVYADLVFNPAHPDINQILWWAENKPSVGGFSPITWGLWSTVAGETVIDILRVESVDLVDHPATTNGFFEQEMKMDPKELVKLQESLVAKTAEAITLTTKLAESETALAEALKRASEAEGKLAAEAAAKLAAERRAARLALIPADFPADLATAEFKEALVASASDETAKLLVETVTRALGAPRSSASTVDEGSAKPVENYESAKKSGLLNWKA